MGVATGLDYVAVHHWLQAFGPRKASQRAHWFHCICQMEQATLNVWARTREDTD